MTEPLDIIDLARIRRRAEEVQAWRNAPPGSRISPSAASEIADIAVRLCDEVERLLGYTVTDIDPRGFAFVADGAGQIVKAWLKDG